MAVLRFRLLEHRSASYIIQVVRPVVPSTSGLNMKAGNALFWIATIFASLISLWVISDYLYGLSEGFPVFNVTALVLAVVIWLLGLFCRRAF
jgi:hypothetical protein